jgi:hypothetical protein
MRVFVLLSHPLRLGKRLAILTKTSRAGGEDNGPSPMLLGGSALRGERSQLTLFPRDPIEKRLELVDIGFLSGETRLNARDGLA